jgi:hypothetical protein
LYKVVNSWAILGGPAPRFLVDEDADNYLLQGLLASNDW